MLAQIDSRELQAWQAFFVWRAEKRKQEKRDAAFDDDEPTVHWGT